MFDSFLSEPPVLHGRARSLPSLAGALPNAAVGVGAFVAVGALAGADGGYFPTTWGWAGISFAWLAATALVLRSRPTLSAPGLVFVGGLAGLLAWTVLSVAWSDSATRTMLEAQRTLVYVAAALALLAVASRPSTGALLGGTLAGITAACTYGLGTRVVPERFPEWETVAGYRLSEPIGYWNGLGILAAIGALLALGFLARGRALHVRMLAAASLPIMTTTLYLTFSRGAWIALAIGLAAAIAFDRGRLHLILSVGVATPAAAVAVWFAARSPAFTSISAPDIDAVREGHRLAIVVVTMSACSALLAMGLARAERRVRVSRRAGRFFARSLMLLLVASLLGFTVQFGMPWTVAAKARDAFLAPPTRVETSLNERLFNLSGSGRHYTWRVAADAFADRPLVGTGAGTYEVEWLERRTALGKVRDAHSLYLETLAELGVVGLLLLAAALTAPLVAAARARRRRLAPFAFAAYVALLAHASVDWDWELPAVMLAGLATAAVLLAGARSEDDRPARAGLRWSMAGFAVALGVLSFAGLLGNEALADSRSAAGEERWKASAARARDAARWAPWSSEPWRRVALAQASGKAARPFFLKAIAKDPRSWELRLELAWASSGKAREQALGRASALNPFSPEVAAYRNQLAADRARAAAAAEEEK